jgi:hypothetical protein
MPQCRCRTSFFHSVILYNCQNEKNVGTSEVPPFCKKRTYSPVPGKLWFQTEMTDAVSQRYGSADPDPDPDPDLYQTVTDPEHCYSLVPSTILTI